MRVSIFQMESVRGQSDVNIAKVEAAMKILKSCGSDVLVLPEFWATGYDLQNAGHYATDITEGIFASVSQMAKEYGIAIVGSNPSQKDGKIYNTAVFFGQSGEILARYDKIHLFTLMEEEKILDSGSDIAVFDTEWGRIGLMICYDLRFPELMRRLVLEGVEVIFIPSYWPEPRLEAWRALLKARAMENQVFVVGCNRSRESGVMDFGYSGVIDPMGKVVAEAGIDEILMTVDIDVNRVREVRERFSFLTDRRDGFYGQF